jgi:hypothetical protein
VEKLITFSKTELENASTTGRDHGITVYMLEEPLLKNLPPSLPLNLSK